MTTHGSAARSACCLSAGLVLACSAPQAMGGASSEGTTSGEVCDRGESRAFIALVGIQDDGTIAWTTLVPDERMLPLPLVADLEGGVVFGTDHASTTLVRHASDGSRVATVDLPGPPQDLAIDGTGQVLYVGRFDDRASYGALAPDLTPLGPRRVLPWDVSLRRYELRIAALPDGSVIVAGGGEDGADRWISQLDPEGSEVWTRQWPVESEPHDFGNAQVAGVAVLADGTSAIALTSGALYEGDLWMEAFHGDGEHAWAVTVEDAPVDGLAATDDTFLVTGSPRFADRQLYGYTSDGTQAWSLPIEEFGTVHVCSNTEFVAAGGTGLVRFTADGVTREHPLDIFALFGSELPPIEGPEDRWESARSDVVCTSEGDAIMVAEIIATREPSGHCETEG